MIYLVFILAAGISWWLGYSSGTVFGMKYAAKLMDIGLKKVLTLDEYKELNDKLINYSLKENNK